MHLERENRKKTRKTIMQMQTLLLSQHVVSSHCTYLSPKYTLSIRISCVHVNGAYTTAPVRDEC